MTDPMGKTCPHCGSAINPWPAGDGWFGTENIRIVPDGEELIIAGRMPAGGFFPRIENVSLTGRMVQRFRHQRMWVRRWAQSEWRDE